MISGRLQTISVLLGLVFLPGGFSPVFSANPPASAAGPYQGFGYAWENNTLGMENRVPAPWTPVKVDGMTLEVWGRKYVFGKALLPQQITSQGQELLASPMRLHLQAGGKKVSDEQTGTQVTESSHEDRAELAGKMSTNEVDVQLRTSLEFDGFLRFDLTLSPKASAVSIEELILEIPFHTQVARFYSRYLDYDFNTQKVDRKNLLTSAGRISGPLEMPFTHTLWVGNHQVGAEFSAETNQEWSNRTPGQAITMVPQTGATLLRLKLVDTPVQIRRATMYSFGLYITPIRPMNLSWRAFIMGHPMQHRFERPAGYNPQLWTFCSPSARKNALPVEYTGLPIPPQDPSQRAQYSESIATAKANGVCVIPYGALMLMHGDVPEVESYRQYWLNNAEARATRLKNWQPSKKAPTVRKAGNAFEINLYSKSIQDFLIWTYVQAAEQWNQDGLYFDVAAGQNNTTNPYAGSLVPGSGKLYQPIFATREFHKRLYKAIKARRPNFLLTQHNAKSPVLFSGFSDIVYSGEAMNAFFLQEGKSRKEQGLLAADDVPYVPDYSRIPDDFWFAMYGSNQGFGQYLLPQVQKWKASWEKGEDAERGRGKRRKARPQQTSREEEQGGKEPSREKDIKDQDRYTRFLLSRTMVLGLPSMRLRLHTGVFDRVMTGLEKFGGLREPLTFLGPHQASQFRTNAPQSHLLTSLYSRPGTKKMLLIVANWTANRVTETIDLNFNGMKSAITEIVSVTDLEGSKPPSHSARGLQIDLPENDFRILMIE